jgi:ribosomal RNA-processing protein 12
MKASMAKARTNKSKRTIESRKLRKSNKRLPEDLMDIDASKSWAYTSDEYASKKNKVVGDIKKDGKLDPYAYWPLDPKILNRWDAKRNVARKGMSSVMKSAKKMQGMSSKEALAQKLSKP